MLPSRVTQGEIVNQLSKAPTKAVHQNEESFLACLANEAILMTTSMAIFNLQEISRTLACQTFHTEKQKSD